MRAPVFLLWAFLALAALPRIVAADAAKVQPDAKKVQTALQTRAKALDRADIQKVATAELRAARKWLVLAGWVADEGHPGQQRKMLHLAELQLQLVERLVTLAKLRSEATRLEQSLARIQRSTAETEKRLEERGGYLEILRNIR